MNGKAGPAEFEWNDSSVFTTNPQMTLAKRQEREDNGDMGPVNSAKRLKITISTQTFKMFSEQGSDVEL